MIATNSKNRTMGISLVNSEKLDGEGRYDCYTSKVTTTVAPDPNDATVRSKLTSED